MGRVKRSVPKGTIRRLLQASRQETKSGRPNGIETWHIAIDLLTPSVARFVSLVRTAVSRAVGEGPLDQNRGRLWPNLADIPAF
jgi:hypothetical protein